VNKPQKIAGTLPRKSRLAEKNLLLSVCVNSNKTQSTVEVTSAVQKAWLQLFVQSIHTQANLQKVHTYTLHK